MTILNHLRRFLKHLWWRRARPVTFPALRGPDGRTAMPERFDESHHLCYLNHDVMVELLRSGELVGAFEYRFPLNEAEAESLRAAADVFEWIEQESRHEERAPILRATVFPALLSDLLHFIYEALQSARKGKLIVAFALLRKPLQENLYLMETIAIDLTGFSDKLAADPMKLRLKNVGGLSGHRNRIAAVLEIIGETDRFDAGYLAQLRYEKCEDGFDGICNLAMHLFTEHDAIKTDKLNINFIFTDLNAKETQWAYLYSRMPYILLYARRLVEHVFSAIWGRTDPVYLSDMERRLDAGTILWWRSVDKSYQSSPLRRFVVATRLRLRSRCRAAGFISPRLCHLERMMENGAFPDEANATVMRRHASYARNAPPRG
jgi:hypothetical protein